MFIIEKEVSHELTINKSRFITFLKPIDSEAAASQYLKEVKKNHPKATHHCYAYIIEPHINRSNDDGEPAGTAGVPILEVLLKQELTNLIAVVVRYYGGIPLGAGGLIRAYSRSVGEALKLVDTYQLVETKVYQVSFGYHQIDLINSFLGNNQILNKDFQETVTYQFATNDIDIIKGITNLTSGTVIPQFLETRLISSIKKDTEK